MTKRIPSVKPKPKYPQIKAAKNLIRKQKFIYHEVPKGTKNH